MKHKNISERGFLFSDGGSLKVGKPILIAREAHFVHRRGITKDDLMLMKDNFDNDVLGLEPYLDFNHDETKPAGWIKSVTLGETKVRGKTYAALFAVPEWNPDGQEALKGGKYKYVSPEIFWEWIHPETGVKYRSVLRSVGVLNRPQIPGQPSIKFTEIPTDIDTDDQDEDFSANKLCDECGNEYSPKEKSCPYCAKEETMLKKLKEIAVKLFGAKFGAEDVTEEQVVAAFEERIKKDGDSVTKLTADLKKATDELSDLKVKYTAIEGGSDGKFKEALEKIEAKFKEKLDEMKAESFKEKVTGLVAKAKVDRLGPAEADGWFKELCEKDFSLAEKTYAGLPVRINKAKPENVIDNAAAADDTKGITTMREEMAKSRGVKFSEVSYREAYDAFYDKKKSETKEDGGE
jgi:hypothetical protein